MVSLVLLRPSDEMDVCIYAHRVKLASLWLREDLLKDPKYQMKDITQTNKKDWPGRGGCRRLGRLPAMLDCERENFRLQLRTEDGASRRFRHWLIYDTNLLHPPRMATKRALAATCTSSAAPPLLVSQTYGGSNELPNSTDDDEAADDDILARGPRDRAPEPFLLRCYDVVRVY